jgi:hypothetical protein
MKQVTTAQIAQWAGQDSVDFLLDVIAEVANGIYTPEQLKQDILDYDTDEPSDDTYDEYGVNTKNSFNTPPKGESK